MEEDFYTVQETARILRTTKRTVRRRPTREAGLGRTQRPDRRDSPCKASGVAAGHPLR